MLKDDLVPQNSLPAGTWWTGTASHPCLRLVSSSEIEFVEGILSLCLTLATTQAGADALLFGQRIDVPGGVVCTTPILDIIADDCPCPHLHLPFHHPQLYHMQEGLASAWRSHLLNASSMKPYLENGNPNPWHQAWRNSLKIAAALLHVNGTDEHVQSASFSLAIVNLEPLQASLRW